MGEQVLSLQIRVQDDGSAVIANFGTVVRKLGDEATSAGAKHKTAWDGAKSALGGVVGQFTAANVAARAVNWGIDTIAGAVSQMFSLGDALAETEAGFLTLAKRAGLDAPAALNAMRAASDGLLTDIELMTRASDLMGTGLDITAEQMGRLTAAAKTLGETHGVELPAALNIFTDAVARGNDKGLLALGIDIDRQAILAKLGPTATESAQKQAFFNAAVEAGSKAAEGAAASGSSLNDMLVQLRVSWENNLASVGRMVNESPALVDILNALMLGAKNVGTALSWLVGHIVDGVTWILKLSGAMNDLKKGWDIFVAGGASAVAEMGEMKAATEREHQQLTILKSVLQGTGMSIVDLKEKYGSYAGIINAISRGTLPDLQEKLKAAQDAQAAQKQEAIAAASAHDGLGEKIQKLNAEYASLTAAEKTKIASSLQVGITTKEIADEMGKAEQTIARYAKALDAAAQSEEKAAKQTTELYVNQKNLQNIWKIGTTTGLKYVSVWDQINSQWRESKVLMPDVSGWLKSIGVDLTTVGATPTLQPSFWSQFGNAAVQALGQLGYLLSGLGDTAGRIAGAISSGLSSIIAAFQAGGAGVAGAIGGGAQAIGQGVGGFTGKAVKWGASLGSAFGPIGAAIGAIGGLIAGGLKKLFSQRSPEQAAAEEVGSQMGIAIGSGLAKQLADVISKAIGKTGGALEDAMVWAIYIPEAQIILFQEQLKKMFDPAIIAAEVERFAEIWMNNTMPVLINELGYTAEAAAKAMQSLIQAGLNVLMQQGLEVGRNMADLVVWAVKLGVEFNTAGLMVRDLNGQLITLNAYLTRMAGVEIFMQKWKGGFEQLKRELADWLNVRDFETRVKGIGDVLAKFFADQVKKIRDMIQEGLSADRLANIANQIMPQLKAITDYQLKALNAMRAAGMSTTEIWNTVGLAMQKQIALMRELGLEGTAAFQKLLEQFRKLRDDAQVVNGMLGPMITFFQTLAKTGELAAKNFEKWSGVALSYLQRMIEAGATTAEVWQALSGIYDVLKQKHDDVMSDLQAKMQTFFDNHKKLTDAQRQAIEDYVNGVGGSLDALAAMGVPQSLLDQIQAWRELHDLVSGPVWDAFQAFYDQQAKLQKWTSLMDQVSALFAAMGTNLITTVAELETWSLEIEKYFHRMIDGGMSLQQIVTQYGGSLHQLYLEYVALGQDVPGWLQKVEREYQKQEAARKAADDAQLAAQIAMLQGFAAIIQALGGDIPDAIQDAIDALQDLRDAANGLTPKPGPGGRPPLAGSIDATRDAALDAAAAVLEIGDAIADTTKEGCAFYAKMKAWLDALIGKANALKTALHGSGVHQALLDVADAADIMGDALSDNLKKAKTDTEDEEDKLERLAKKLERIKNISSGLGSMFGGLSEAGLITPENVGMYEQTALKYLTSLKASGADFGTIFSTLQQYAESLGPGATTITAMYESLQAVAPFLGILDSIKSTAEAAGKKLGRGTFGTLASTLMSIYTNAGNLIGGSETLSYMKSTLEAFKDYDKSWRGDVGGFAALMQSAGYRAGLDYVPHDRFPLLAHRAEKLLPADEAEWYREWKRNASVPRPRGGDGAVMPGAGRPINLHVTINALDTRSMREAVRRDVIPVINEALKDNTGGLTSYVQKYGTT